MMDSRPNDYLVNQDQDININLFCDKVALKHYYRTILVRFQALKPYNHF